MTSSRRPEARSARNASTSNEDDSPLVALAELPMSALAVADGVIVVATKRAARLLGVDADTLVGRRVSDLLGDRAADVAPEPAGASASGRPRPLPALPVQMNGAVRALAYCLIPLVEPRASLVLLESSDGSILGRGHGRENSEGYLIAGVAHEINNPLTFVAPALDELKSDLLMRRDAARTLPVGHWLNLIGEASAGVSRIAGVVKRLREMREGRADVEPTLVNQVVLDTLRLAAVSIPPSVTLRRDFGQTLPARGNRERLAQVILNLVLNASHALSDKSQGGGRIFVRTWTQGSQTCLEVRDDGCGVPERLRDKIFEPFFTTRSSGSGLGLALCRSMIREWGGDLSLQPTGPRGACFRIGLPLWQGAAAPAAPEEVSLAAESTTATRKRSVLLVDDDQLVRRALARMLQKHHRVTEASSVDEALELAEKRDFDVLITDLVMSHGGGRALIQQLKQRGSPLARHVIVISGMAPDATPPDYLRLPKPCRAADLLSAVERVTMPVAQAPDSAGDAKSATGLQANP